MDGKERLPWEMPGSWYLPAPCSDTEIPGGIWDAVRAMLLHDPAHRQRCFELERTLRGACPGYRTWLHVAQQPP